jgi:hypothetical protein
MNSFLVLEDEYHKAMVWGTNSSRPEFHGLFSPVASEVSKVNSEE